MNIITLFKIEYLKLIKNRMFWVTLLAYLLTIVLALLIIRGIIQNFNTKTSEAMRGIKLLPSEVYTFPLVWHYLTFLAKYFKIFLAVILVIIVTNEYAFNTLRQNLITGLSRLELVVSKYITAILLAGLSTVLIFIFGLIGGFMNTPKLEMVDIFSKMYFLLTYFFMLISYLSMVIFLSFLVKKTGLVLGILLVYSYIFEPILSYKFGDYGNFLPLSAINSIIEFPDSGLTRLFNIHQSIGSTNSTSFIISLVYLVVFFGSTYWVLKKRDL